MRNSKTVETGEEKIHGNIINRAEGFVECWDKEERLFWDHTQLLSRITASLSCGGKKTYSWGDKGRGSSTERRCAPLHEPCPSIFFCPKSLPVNENVAISTDIQQMLQFFFSSRKVIAIIAQHEEAIESRWIHQFPAWQMNFPYLAWATDTICRP